MRLLRAFLVAAILFASAGAVAGTDDDIKATFERFVAAQNAHDLTAVRNLLLDSPTFLWITRGTPIWTREAALKRFETLYQGTWKLNPDRTALRIIMLSDTSAHLFVPITFSIGAPGQPAADTVLLVNQILVKTSASAWRVASILPIPIPPPAATPPK